jgi:hypothetical protein
MEEEEKNTPRCLARFEGNRKMRTAKTPASEGGRYTSNPGLLVETEVDFELDARGNRTAVGAEGGFAAPGAHGLHGGVVKTEAGALDDAGFGNAAIHSDNGVDENYARIFCFASFFRVRRVGHIEAAG